VKNQGKENRPVSRFRSCRHALLACCRCLVGPDSLSTLHSTLDSPLARAQSSPSCSLQHRQAPSAHVCALPRTGATRCPPASPPTSRSGPPLVWTTRRSVPSLLPPAEPGSQAGWQREAAGHLPVSEQKLSPAGGRGNPWRLRTMSSSPVPPKVGCSASYAFSLSLSLSLSLTP
jgi:hypothetical protein